MATMMIFSGYAYYLATFSDANVPARKIPMWADGDNATECTKCNKWKPDRAHHCTICSKCTYKMDHHCPWLVNCVGHKNHKTFLVFNYYMAMGGLYFLYRSVCYWQWAAEEEILWDHSLFFLLWWFLTIVICGAVCIMLTGLAILHTLLALNNLTTLDMMGGYSLRLPGVPEHIYLARPGYYPSPKDIGMFANICNFFDHDALFWWLPSLKDAVNEGTQEIGAPDVSDYNAAVAKQKQAGPYAPLEPKLALRPLTLSEFKADDWYKKAEVMVDNRNVRMYDQVFYYGKRKDNAYKEQEKA
jgi:hypothetical protein